MKNSILLSVCVFVSVASMVVSRRWSFFATMRGDSNSPQQYYRQQETMYDVQHSFPVSPHDFEEIDHPAAVYLQSSYPEGLSKTLSVPRFWNPPAYGGDIRQYLGGGKGLMSKEKALTVGSFVEEKETIYLTIASYRDSDCINTVQSAFSVAAYPERLRIVVIEQIREGDTVCTIPTEPSCQEDPDQVLCKYSHLIESFEMDARLAVGPTFARHIGHRYYRGEYFVLQVDAHVRFVRDWDESIINQWKLANNEMAVLTNYMLDLNGAIDENGNSRKKGKSLICNSDFEGDYLRHGQQPPRPSSSSDDPVLSPFWAAGFSFARGHFVVQVPYDAYLTNVFQGEEYNLGLRGFTYGYDYYAPEHSVCFHMYAVHKNSENRLAVPRFSENKSVFGKHLVNELANEGTKRLSGILQVNGESATYNRIEEEKYGIGHVRTTDKFFRTCK